MSNGASDGSSTPELSPSQARYCESSICFAVASIFVLKHGFRIVFYRVFDSTSMLALRNTFAPVDNMLGRVDVRNITPPQTIRNLKIHIARVENLDPFRMTIYPNTDPGGDAITDITSVAVVENHGFGTAPDRPLAILLRDSPQPGTPIIAASPPPPVTVNLSPMILPSPYLSGTPPPSSPSVTLPPASISTTGSSSQQNTHSRSESGLR